MTERNTPKEGALELSGNGCSIDPDAGGGGLWLVAFAAVALALFSRRAGHA